MHKFKQIAVPGMVFVFLLGLLLVQTARAQDFATGLKSLIIMDRGIVWDSWDGVSHLAGGGCGYSWFAKKMDFPGYEPGLIQAEGIGTWPTHMFEVSFGIIALRSPGFFPTREPRPDLDVQYGATVISGGFIDNPDYDPSDSISAWILPVNQKRWLAGENYYLRTNHLEAEEIVDSRLERNPYFKYTGNVPELDRHFLPVRIDWSIRLWTGSRQDQMYEIEEMKVQNMSNDSRYDGKSGDDMTLYECFFMNNYFGCVNMRSSTLLASRNSRGYDDAYEFDEERGMFIEWDDDWKDPTSTTNDKYDFVPGLGPADQGEWAASGYLGFGFLHTSPDNNGRVANLHSFWTARCENPGSGTDSPYQGLTTWGYFVEGTRSNFALRDNPRDVQFGTALWNTHLTTGPYDMAPGEIVDLISFKGIGSVDLEIAMNLDRMASAEVDIPTGRDSLMMLWDRALLATKMAKVPGYATGGIGYAGWNMPDPPACPYDFTITPYFGEDATIGNVPGNIISWNDWADTKEDKDYAGMPATTTYPDGEAFDLKNYTVWKSEYLPIMGWRPLKLIARKDPLYYNATTKYKYIDTAVKIGFSYFYALSSGDAGHDTWPPRPEALTEYPTVFPTGKVKPMQSNLMASLNYPGGTSKWVAFRTYRTPGTALSQIRVFPNPFVMRAGFINPTDQDGIHFANIPANCEIRIYSVRGDLIATGPGTIQMKQDAGSGEAVWRQLTIAEQYVESGLYFYVIEAQSGPDKGDTHRGKFVIIR